MAEGKKSFVMYSDLIHTVEKMPDEAAGKLLKHLLRYVNDLNPTPEDMLTEIIFEPIKQQLKRDLKKWEGKSETNAKNGREGGIKSGIARAKKRNEANASNGLNKRSETKRNEHVSVNVNVSDNVNEEVIHTNTNARAGDFESLELGKSQNTETGAAQITEQGREIINSIMQFWGLTEMRDNLAFRQIAAFARTICHRNRAEAFIQNFKAYKELITTTDRKRFGWQKFIGTADEHFENGPWALNNYESELIASRKGGSKNKPSRGLTAHHEGGTKTIKVWRDGKQVEVQA